MSCFYICSSLFFVVMENQSPASFECVDLFGAAADWIFVIEKFDKWLKKSKSWMHFHYDVHILNRFNDFHFVSCGFRLLRLDFSAFYRSCLNWLRDCKFDNTLCFSNFFLLKIKKTVLETGEHYRLKRFGNSILLSCACQKSLKIRESIDFFISSQTFKKQREKMKFRQNTSSYATFNKPKKMWKKIKQIRIVVNKKLAKATENSAKICVKHPKQALYEMCIYIFSGKQ